jgi:cyclopropane fatty-acyl-phospholipid synthase-like methyltransferase
VLDLNFDNNYFDLAMDFGCFHHLRKNQWNKYIKNLMKITKTNSYYLLYCFSKESKETGNYKIGKDYSYHNHHYNHYFNMNDLKQIFEKNFKIIKKAIISEKNRLLKFNLVLMKKNKN